MSGVRKRLVSTLAYSMFLVVGLIQLATLVFYVIGDETWGEALFWAYVPFYLLVAPGLSVLGTAIALACQFWGIEWKLLVLFGATVACYAGVFVADLEESVTIPHGIICTVMSAWHFLSRRDSLGHASAQRRN